MHSDDIQHSLRRSGRPADAPLRGAHGAVDGRAVQLVQPELQRELPLEPVLAGEVALPVGDVPEPFVDAEDIADVAAAALTEDGHAGRVYELTGPRLLTFGEAVAEIARASGRQVRFVPVPMADYVSAMAGNGVPGEVVSLLHYLFTEVLDGRNAHLTDGVQRVLGHEPRDFAQYAPEAAASGVWDG
jgi:uncharacterized protein YbjT (DUF2867 family)